MSPHIFVQRNQSSTRHQRKGCPLDTIIIMSIYFSDPTQTVKFLQLMATLQLNDSVYRLSSFLFQRKRTQRPKTPIPVEKLNALGSEGSKGFEVKMSVTEARAFPLTHNVTLILSGILILFAILSLLILFAIFYKLVFKLNFNL